MSELDPDCERVVREFRAAGLPEWHVLSVAGARRLEDELFSPDEPPDDGVVTRDLAIDGPGGELPLRDEGRAYAARLADAGVAVERVHEPALPHGFLSLTDESVAAERAMAECCGALRERLTGE